MGAGLFAHAEELNFETTQCADSNDPEVYDFYVGTEFEEGESPSLDPYPGLELDGFSDGDLIEDAGGSYDVTPIEITSGKLWAKQSDWGMLGFTDTYNFRGLAVPPDVSTQWNDLTVKASFSPKQWQDPAPSFAGIHLFARYQTEDDLYVVSLRRNGAIYIFRKLCGNYTKIASHTARDANNTKLATGGELPLNQWYELEVSVQGKTLSFNINGVKQFNLSRYNGGYVDLTEAWSPNSEPLTLLPTGTAGVRLDYVDSLIGGFDIFQKRISLNPLLDVRTSTQANIEHCIFIFY